MSSNDRRQRIREQMKQFYGDPTAAGGSASRRAQESGRRGSDVAPEMDLDSEFFNVMKYTTNLLRKESLKGLVESDTELLRSVRRLDGELQELVYRNYAKFISATDTIREMRDNVAQMDTKLQALSSNVASIDEVSKSISDKLQEHHGRIEGTITTNRMLKKIQFLVELPATMRRMLERQEYSVCARYWVAGDGFLKRHEAIPSIAKIQVECRGLAKELYAKMESAMCAVSLDDPEAMDGIRGYVENLRLLRATTLFSAEEQKKDEDSTTFDEAVLKVLMGSVSANFTSGVAAVQRSVKAALAVPANLKVTELARREELLAQASLREALAQLKSTCALLSVNSERVYSLLNRLDGSKVAMRVTQEVQPVLIDLLAPVSKQLGELAAAVFASIANEGFIVLETPEKVSAAVQAAVSALVRQLKHFVVTLKTLGANYLDTALSRQSSSYAAMVDQAVGDVLSRCVELLREKAWQQPDRAALHGVVGSYVTAAGGSAALASATVKDKAADEQLQKNAFAASRWTYGAIAARLVEECRTQLVQGEAVAGERLADCLASVSQAARLLLHRGIMLFGQLEVGAVAASAFGPSSGPANAGDGSGGAVDAAVAALVHEGWPLLCTVLDALPPIIPTEAPVPLAGGGAGGPPKAGAASGQGSTLTVGSPASYTGRMFTSGSSAGRSSGPRSAMGGPGSAAGGKAGKPVVSYLRREDVVLQSSVERIFSNGAVAVLQTMPRDGRPATIMAALVLYLLKAIVSHVRAAVCEREYDQTSFQRLQLCATFLLRALTAPGKPSPLRHWIKHWDDSTHRAMQQQLDEACCTAYEHYDAKVPLSNAALEKTMEEAAVRTASAPVAAAPALDERPKESDLPSPVVPTPAAATAPSPVPQSSPLSGASSQRGSAYSPAVASPASASANAVPSRTASQQSSASPTVPAQPTRESNPPTPTALPSYYNTAGQAAPRDPTYAGSFGRMDNDEELPS